jgi:hypothetical protein
MKELILVPVFMLALGALVLADEPKGSLGLGRMHGYNAGASQSGCGSSWAICRYRAQWRGRYQGSDYRATQQRLATKCNRQTAWMDACR